MKRQLATSLKYITKKKNNNKREWEWQTTTAAAAAHMKTYVKFTDEGFYRKTNVDGWMDANKLMYEYMKIHNEWA